MKKHEPIKLFVDKYNEDASRHQTDNYSSRLYFQGNNIYLRFKPNELNEEEHEILINGSATEINHYLGFGRDFSDSNFSALSQSIGQEAASKTPLTVQLVGDFDDEEAKPHDLYTYVDGEKISDYTLDYQRDYANEFVTKKLSEEFPEMNVCVDSSGEDYLVSLINSEIKELNESSLDTLSQLDLASHELNLKSICRQISEEIPIEGLNPRLKFAFQFENIGKQYLFAVSNSHFDGDVLDRINQRNKMVRELMDYSNQLSEENLSLKIKNIDKVLVDNFIPQISVRLEQLNNLDYNSNPKNKFIKEDYIYSANALFKGKFDEAYLAITELIGVSPSSIEVLYNNSYMPIYQINDRGEMTQTESLQNVNSLQDPEYRANKLVELMNGAQQQEDVSNQLFTGEIGAVLERIFNIPVNIYFDRHDKEILLSAEVGDSSLQRSANRYLPKLFSDGDVKFEEDISQILDESSYYRLQNKINKAFNEPSQIINDTLGSDYSLTFQSY
ncbi:hypothetical protein [Hutsoniella sourekii]|uniref:hypothetical protein n=1 Tax=Hutsoniella sourekii TaxID=87650 RepID=UPI0012ED8B62|nr:hypothetical protein [Hutsoniella sourekii]